MRAKRRLDKIALLTRPRVTVIRDGEEQTIDQDDIVKDDLIVLRSGDQALVDGTLESCYALEMDESALTGESKAVRKNTGDRILSGTVCISGEGAFIVDAFGDESYASKMLANARKYVAKNTPLQMETGTITKILMVTAAFLMGITLLMEIFRGHDLEQLLELLVLCLDVVPIGLFLLVTLTYMIAAVRMADSGVLLQNSNSVESISHVDTVCMDKTGTITTNRLVFECDHPLIDADEAARICSVFASSTKSRNRTMQAMLDHYDDAGCALEEEIQFSSARQYSAVRAGGYTLVSGAWTALKPICSNPEGIDEYIDGQSSKGLRTLVVFRSDRDSLYQNGEPDIGRLEAVSIVSISDEVRPDCRETMQVFMDNDMDIKVISGDNPDTIDALFSIAGIPGERRIVTGTELEGMSPEEFDKAAAECNIFGRMKPENKEAVIRSLRRQGRYLAMIGDGVNDVGSIKMAHVGISLESGTAAARGVADMVLLEDRFSALPKALVEGRRTVSGMRDILKLYLSRNFTMALLFLAIFVFTGAIPMTPIQNTFYAFVSVAGIAFFMTIFAKPDKNSELILPKVLQYVIPVAITITSIGVISYALTWYLVDSGRLVVDFEWMLQQVPDSIAETVDELIDRLSWNGSSVAEICARSAMVLTVTVAGVLQLVLVSPRWKFLSVDGNVNKSLLPPFLMFLLYGAVITMITVFPVIAIGLVGMVIFPGWFYGVIVALVAVWFAVTLLLLRHRAFAKYTQRFEDYYMKKLALADEKQSPEAPMVASEVEDGPRRVLYADGLHIRQLVVGYVMGDHVRDQRFGLPGIDGIRSHFVEIRKLPPSGIYQCYTCHGIAVPNRR